MLINRLTQKAKAVFLLSLLGFFIILRGVYGQAARPLWTVDLASDPEFAKRASLNLTDFDIKAPRIQFAGEQTVVVGFEDDSPNSPRTLKPKHFEFDLLAFDSESGKVSARRAFPVVNLDSDMRAGGAADLLVLSGESLSKLSSNLQTVATYSTPLAYHGGPVPIEINGQPCLSEVYEGWKMSIAPSNNILVLQRKGHREGSLTWLRESDLSVMRTIPDDQPSLTIDATDDSVLIRRLPLRYSMEPNRNDAPNCQMPECHAQYIVGNGEFLQDCGGRYRLVDRNGNVLISGALLFGIDSLTRAMNGSRIGFLTASLSFGGLTLAGFFSNGHTRIDVVVIDLSNRKELKRIRLEQAAETKSTVTTGAKQAFALSPGGHKMALLVGSKLTCYSLP